MKGIVFSRWLTTMVVAGLVAACGGGGGDDPAPAPPPPAPPPAPSATLTINPPTLTLAAGGSATVQVNVARGGGFAGDVAIGSSGAPAGTTIGTATIAAGSTSATLTISADNSVAGATTNVSVTGAGSGVTIAAVTLALTTTAAPPPPTGVEPIGTAILEEANSNNWGHSVALSADGMRLIGGGTTNDGSGTDAGHARVFQRNGSTWVQMGGDLDAEAGNDRAGQSVAINDAGTRVAVGAYLNDGAAPARGHVRVHDWNSSAWVQTGPDIDPPIGSGAGYAVRLSSSGHRVVVGAPGVNTVTGYVFVYELSGGTWVQQGASLTGSADFGLAVDISDDGNRIAVGIPGAMGSTRAGSVNVYEWNGSAWVALGAPMVGEALGDTFGFALALSADGARIVVGGPGNTDGGVSGGGSAAGHVRVYEFAAGAWTQLGADVDGKVGLNGDNFGSDVSISADGSMLIASGPNMSVARVYRLVAGAWVQVGADRTDGSRADGVALSADGSTAAVGYINGTGLVQAYSVTP